MDYQIPGSDLVLKKGMGIIIPVHSIHHDSRYYRDPERFDPERFSPEAEKLRAESSRDFQRLQRKFSAPNRSGRGGDPGGNLVRIL